MGLQELTEKQASILNSYVISGLFGVPPVLPWLPGLVALMESHWRWMASHHMGGELFHPKPALFPRFEFPRGFVVVAAPGAGGVTSQACLARTGGTGDGTIPGRMGWWHWISKGIGNHLEKWNGGD